MTIERFLNMSSSEKQCCKLRCGIFTCQGTQIVADLYTNLQLRRMSKYKYEQTLGSDLFRVFHMYEHLHSHVSCACIRRMIYACVHRIMLCKDIQLGFAFWRNYKCGKGLVTYKFEVHVFHMSKMPSSKYVIGFSIWMRCWMLLIFWVLYEFFLFLNNLPF